MTALLEAQHVTKIFGGGLIKRHRTVALEDFSLSIGGGQPTITGVVGESGSGKTTMARLLLGMESPTQGEVLYQGKALRQLSRAEWRAFRRDVQIIFQDPFEVYNPFYTVDHVLTVPIAKFHLANSALIVVSATSSNGTRINADEGARISVNPHESVSKS